MQPLWIAVSILFAVGITILLCMAIAFSWYLVLQMRKLQASADASVKVMQEVLGDGALIYIQKSLRLLVDQAPDGIAAVKSLVASMALFTKTVFSQEATPKAAPSEDGDDSAFFGYDEANASQVEANQRHRREKLDLSKKELSGMRSEGKTEKITEKVPEEILPPRPPDAPTKLTSTAL